MADKNRNKELKKMFKQKSAEDFENNLPMERIVFKDLSDYLDVELGKKHCDHTLRSTKVFFIEKRIASPATVIEWLAENGGYCDCEILNNIEEKFE